jgi:ABC-type Mn2+/Zn2+ transport system permease subunit
MPEPRGLSRDAVLGVAYVVASALILIIADRIPQDSHDIRDILFGNAVAVEARQMMVAVIVSAFVLLVHALLFRPFLSASFDPETAAAHGVPVRAVDALLFLTVGLTIAAATKTIGAMPVFAFAILPAAAGLCVFADTRLVLLAAALVGAASAFLGYWISFVGSFPTGPCMAVVSSAFLALAMLYSRIRRGRWC